MLELDRLIDAAVAEAPPPDLTRVHRVVRRRRRRRALVRTTAIGGLTVAIAAFLFVPRGGPANVITTPSGTAPTTQSSAAGAPDFSSADLGRGLVALGHSARIVEAPPDASSLLGTRPAVLCVDGAAAVQVYEYASDAARMAWSRAISPDGGSISRGNSRTQVLWIAPPHFFARGRVIALYLGSDNRLIADLGTVLGPTLDPKVPQGASTRHQPCS